MMKFELSFWIENLQTPVLLYDRCPAYSYGVDALGQRNDLALKSFVNAELSVR